MNTLTNLLLALRSLFFVVLLPGTATVLVPRWILAESGGGPPFGDSYACYRSAVRRWLPGRPYDGGSRRGEWS